MLDRLKLCTIFTLTTMKSQDQIQRRPVRNFIVIQRMIIIQLLAIEYQTLLVGWNTLLILNSALDALDRVAVPHIHLYRFPSQRFHDY
jgi:hypothetical protein